MIERPPLPDHVAFASLGEDDLPWHPPHPSEIHLVERVTAETRRRDVLLGRAAARVALDELGVDRAAIERGRGGEPIWPESVVGSISHAAGVALAAVGLRADTGGIGIDLEGVRPFPGLLEQVARPEEIADVADASEHDRGCRAFELFSAKESIFKAFYPRIQRHFWFQDARLTAREDGGFDAHLVQPLDPGWPPDRTFRVDLLWMGDLVLTWVVLPAD